MIKRVLIAMSGGVDSSLAAALLVQQGCAVEGVTMKLTAGVCCDIGSAQAVCAHLGIPHRMLDLQDRFRDAVVANFIDEYRHGRTPNPCIRCNDIVKFDALLDYARSEEFDHLATGHYARIDWDERSARYLLRKGIDPAKDQSYFLYRMNQEQLAHTLFPVGGLRKTEVRTRAAEMQLPAAERPESQDVCFIPGNDYRAFLREHAPDVIRGGDMVLQDGSVVGKHDGIALFTVGQRRNLGVAAGERLYVVRVEPETNRVVLGKQEELGTREMKVSNPNFIAVDALSTSLRVGVKIRYRSALAKAMIEPAQSDNLRVTFDQPVPGVCPGQAAVFYDGDVVIGGGTIEP